ncbi:MAG: excinuclease ABC subunit UvrC [Flavobacteriales bacterium]
MERTPHLQALLERLPHEPGIYQHYDAAGRLLYVGKAKDLRKRVTSYFTGRSVGKTRLLVAKIADIRWIVTPTEGDALLLENSLIKEHKPLYNILLKDDKTYPFIVLKREPFPRVFPTRRVVRDGSEYFGPYPSAKSMHTVLELCRTLYPIRTCALPLNDAGIAAGKWRVCLEFHIGNCLGPCAGLQSEAAYDASIRAIRSILQGDMAAVMRLLEGQMRTAADELRFEEAARIQRRLEAVRSFLAKNTIVHPSIDDVDVFTVARDARVSLVNFLRIRNGSIVQGHTTEVRARLDEDERQVLEAAIPLIRDRFGSTSRTVFTAVPVDIALSGVTFTVPQRGDKKRLVDLSTRNATAALRDRMKQLEQTDPEAATEALLTTVRDELRLTELPRHIECFDNSNLHGTSPASACVVFRNGKPSKSDYRTFTIRTVQGPDDFASMTEVITRRYSRLVAEGADLPQLIVVDGGKGQLSHAAAALDALGLRGRIALIGIAKRLEELYFPEDPVPLHLDKRSLTLRLIQHLRNEAHRFSLGHHRGQRSKAALRSELDGIPGVGPAMRMRLLTAFPSVDAIRAAPVAALEAAVPAHVARAVRAFFDAPPTT